MPERAGEAKDARERERMMSKMSVRAEEAEDVRENGRGERCPREWGCAQLKYNDPESAWISKMRSKRCLNARSP